MYTPRIEPNGKKTRNKYENVVNSPRLVANDHRSKGTTLQATVDTTTRGTSCYGWYDYYGDNILYFAQHTPLVLGVESTLSMQRQRNDKLLNPHKYHRAYARSETAASSSIADKRKTVMFV